MSVDVTDIKYLRSVEAVVIKVKRLLESNSKVLQERYFVSFNKTARDMIVLYNILP